MSNQIDLRETCTTGPVWLNRLSDAVVDLFFPAHCVTCQRVGTWLCGDCLARVERIHPPVCCRCGLPLATLTAPHSCQVLPSLDGLFAYAFHAGPLRQAIHDFKYRDLRALAAPLGRLMGAAWADLAGEDATPDLVVPIPLHATRQRQRGYNQSALLARELAVALQRPLVQDLLVRIRATVPQVDLDAEQRRANVQGAFRCQGRALVGNTVLLVDDVCTTGSTLASASQALKEAGAVSVVAYTLARATSQAEPATGRQPGVPSRQSVPG